MYTFTAPVLDSKTGTPTSNAAGLRGDTIYLTISNSTLAGWTGRTWTAQLRVDPTDTDPVASFTVIDSTDADSVSVYFQLQTDSIAPGKYVYDVQYVVTDPDITTTVLRGKVTISEDVTR